MFQLKEDLVRDALSDASPKTATCLAVFKIIGLISSQQSLPSSMTLCIYTGLCLTPQRPALKCTSHDNRKLVCLPHHSDLPCSGRV